MSNEELNIENGKDSKYLFNHLPKDQIEKVNQNNYNELCPDFMGFVTNYKKMSEIIPNDFTIVDIGCASASQCYYFKDFKQYIGIDAFLKDILGYRFNMPNTIHLQITANDFLSTDIYKQLDLNKTFAIMNYVPNWFEINKEEIRKSFPNLFVFYPSIEKERIV